MTTVIHVLAFERVAGSVLLVSERSSLLPGRAGIVGEGYGDSKCNCVVNSGQHILVKS